MTPRQWGFLISRSLAVIGLYQLIGTVVGVEAGDAGLFGGSSGIAPLARFSALAFQGVTFLAYLWILGNLWSRARQFGDLDSARGQAPMSAKDGVTLVLFGLGLYFLVKGLATLVQELIYIRMFDLIFRQGTYWRLVEPSVALVAGIVMLIAAKNPVWIHTWSRALVSLARVDYETDEQESHEQ